ncbi:MAG: ATP-binding protein [Candidatus Hydrogenedentota bacterium]|nr:MAG: ATP-binding protein [Candidatus Hydrogenedentota bacterium]
MLTDKSAMKKVFTNLVRNAKEATDRFPATMEIEINCNQEECQVVFRDFGRGISLVHQEKIFSKGFSTKPDGEGIGLWLAKQMVQKHGGELKLLRSNGQVTEFILTLPL